MTGLESWIDDSARKYSFALVHNWFIQNWRGQFFLNTWWDQVVHDLYSGIGQRVMATWSLF